MKVSYGPPPVAGVKNLQYLSGTGTALESYRERYALPVAKYAGLAYLGAKITGQQRVKKYAFWTAVGALVWHFGGAPKAPPAQPPATGG